MSGHLQDLLETLGGAFRWPYTLDRTALREVLGGPWLSAEAARSIASLLEAPDPDPVTFAGLFLVGRDGPTLHLELSAHQAGRLQDPATLADLAPLYAAAGLDLPAEADHLSSLAGLLAALLRRGAEDDGARKAALALAQGPLRVLLTALEPALAQREGAEPFPVLLRALEASRALTVDMLD